MAAKMNSKKKRNRVRRDDEIYILCGEHAGRAGKILSINRDSSRVEVEIPNLPDEEKIQKHQKPNNDFPTGTILKLNPTLHVSNVMKLDAWNARPKRQGAVVVTEKADTE